MKLIIEKGNTVDKLCVNKDAGDLPDKMLEEAWDWLSDVKGKEFAACNKIRRLCSETTWARYETWGDEKEYRELRLFREALKLFVARVSAATRPPFFKPTQCKSILGKTKRAKIDP